MKRFISIIFIFITFLFSVTKSGFCQVMQEASPFGMASPLKSSNGYNLSTDVPIINMPDINSKEIDQIIQNNNSNFGTSYQFAVGFDSIIIVKDHSVVDSIDIGLLYRIKIRSEGALSINIIFENYNLPSGAKLFIYNNKENHYIGAFTSNNNKTSKVLPTLPVKGDEVTIEYFEPYFPDFDGTLNIATINHDFIGFYNYDDDFRVSGECNVDINCSPEGDNWQDEKRSVCKILTYRGKTLCSGALINNVLLDGTPYILTANHCFKANYVEDVIFIFNYESPECNGPDGHMHHSISGGTLVARWPDQYGYDFYLLRLSRLPYTNWHPYYAGWDNRNIPKNNVTGIHHPRGDVKKISIENDMIHSSEYPKTAIDPNADHWRIRGWDIGTVEHASSGSPLFDEFGRIIGQLHGGYTECDGLVDNGEDCWYGKMSMSWDNGGTQDSRLMEWLDPTLSGVEILDGIDVCSEGTRQNHFVTQDVLDGQSDSYLATENIFASNTVYSGGNLFLTAGERIEFETGFVAQKGSYVYTNISEQNCIIGCDQIKLLEKPNSLIVGNSLCYNVINAIEYEVYIYNRWDQLIYSGSGDFDGEHVCVWDGTEACGLCTYRVDLRFRSHCDEFTDSYILTAFGGKKSYVQDVISSVEETKEETSVNIDKFEFNIYPNPNNGNFNVYFNSIPETGISIKIVNLVSEIVFEKRDIYSKNLEINDFNTSKGIYFFQAKYGNKTVNKRFIIL